MGVYCPILAASPAKHICIYIFDNKNGFAEMTQLQSAFAHKVELSLNHLKDKTVILNRRKARMVAFRDFRLL